MHNTLIIQSHRKPLPGAWISQCLKSVKNWAKLKGYEYRFFDDELFEILPEWVIDKTKRQVVIATDLARLKWLQKLLALGYERVVWIDADFLIFSPHDFQLMEGDRFSEQYALGREVWVQAKSNSTTATNKIKVYTKVHNAFLIFAKGNHFLDFYTAHAERLLKITKGPMPPQFIGPKLLTALHNIIQCPVQENAGMLSPWVIKDKLNGGGSALDTFRQKTQYPLLGANLCSSLVDGVELQDNEMENLVEKLLMEGVV